MTQITRRILLAFVLGLAALGVAQAQSLTPAQLSTLRTDILADQALAPKCVPYGDGPFDIAAAYNLPASPSYIVWRTRVSRDDVTGDGFDWTQVDNLTTGQARIWELIFATQTGTISFAEPGKRAGISETWKGTAAKVAVATFILDKAKRSATRAERVLATGTGTQAVPGTMTFEGVLSANDVQRACNT